MGKSQPKATKKRARGTWPHLAEAKGYGDRRRCPVPPVAHIRSFLREKPLARSIPHPVATPRLPPQEKIRELRRFLWHVATQKFPSARLYAQSTVTAVGVYRLYGLTTRSEKNAGQFMASEHDEISAEMLESQINQFYIRVITHAFKTWRQMLRVHREARESLAAEEGATE